MTEQDRMETSVTPQPVLGTVTVDSNAKCRGCALRYLCGGFCRAWTTGRHAHPDAPLADCDALYRKAASRLEHALQVLEVNPRIWAEQFGHAVAGGSPRRAQIGEHR